MKETKLKPCPFCGKPAEVHVTPRFPSGEAYLPRCTDKSCHGRSQRKYTTIEAAVYSWNRRPKNG